jgi:hypothetical protein
MSDMPRGIYVQIDIRAPLDRVWQLTQTPSLHQQWDLRFSTIEYLPRPDPQAPQRFLYATRIGLGLRIQGEGETVGSHDSASGERTSALKFWSDDPKSLIRSGSGYWKYVPSSDGVRFLTLYDYQTRFGVIGRLFDRMIFRPLLAWATAWSFDRLRIWLEKGIDPAISMQRFLIHAAARCTLAFVWLYQGVVPKLIFHHADERSMLHAAGLSAALAQTTLTVIGWCEVAIGLLLILIWRWRWPLWITLILMPLAAIGVAVTSPSFLAAPFNPIVLNTTVFALAAIALLSAKDLPSANRCVRRLPRENV